MTQYLIEVIYETRSDDMLGELPRRRKKSILWKNFPQLLIFILILVFVIVQHAGAYVTGEREYLISLEFACIESYLLSQENFDWENRCYKKNSMYGMLSNSIDELVKNFEGSFGGILVVQSDDVENVEYLEKISQEVIPPPAEGVAFQEEPWDSKQRLRVFPQQKRSRVKKDFFLSPFGTAGRTC